MTKIIGTIGPSSNTHEKIEALIDAGMNVARLNFSHGTHESHQKTFEMIREVSEDIAIAIDIAGPKIRLGTIKETYELELGEKVVIVNDDSIIGTRNKFSINYPSLYKEVKPGSPLYINDGLVRLEVTEVKGTDIHCIVKDGGLISTRKGVNAPDSNIALHVPTKKDIKDIEKACELETDYLFISFVRSEKDLNNIKEIIESKTTDKIPIISKIEHGDAVKNINRIFKNSDGLMVARGDLGIEVGPALVPVLQKQFIKLGINAGKPVIVATQMLESMTREPLPTRAEASDVAHAVFDGADAVMLSAETATGNFPIEAVKTMSEIIKKAEHYKRDEIPQVSISTDNINEAIGTAATELSKKLNAKAIVALTKSGFSARMVSRNRLLLPIFAATPEIKTKRRAQLYWGVIPVFHQYEEDYDQLVYNSVRGLFEKKLLEGTDTVVLVGGSFLGIPGKTNTIQIFRVDEVLAGKH